MNSPRLLLIDHLSPYQHFIKDVLEKDGYEVRIHEDSNGLKKVLSEFNPDIILIDIEINNYEGFNTLSSLKKNYSYKGPIIIISNEKRISEIEKAFNLGAYDYLIKPLNLRDLINKTRQSITKHKLKKK